MKVATAISSIMVDDFTRVGHDRHIEFYRSQAMKAGNQPESKPWKWPRRSSEPLNNKPHLNTLGMKMGYAYRNENEPGHSIPQLRFPELTEVGCWSTTRVATRPSGCHKIT